MASPDVIVEGIGNEVLLTGVLLFVSILIYAAFSIRSIRQSLTIHPSNVAAVNSARSILFSDRLSTSNTDNQGDTTSTNGPSSRASVRHYGMDSQCPICLNEPRLPIETNCGHLFCGNCIVIYWRLGNWSTSGPIKCPVCRQQVTLLLCCFQFRPDASSTSSSTSDVTSQSSTPLPSETDRQRVLRDINDYNRRYSGEPRPWLDYIRDLPTLLRHVSNEFFTLGGLMYMLRIRIVFCFIAAIMYLVSPLDIIPEAVFGLLGLLDDFLVILVIALYVSIIYRRFLATRWQNDTF